MDDELHPIFREYWLLIPTKLIFSIIFIFADEIPYCSMYYLRLKFLSFLCSDRTLFWEPWSFTLRILNLIYIGWYFGTIFLLFFSIYLWFVLLLHNLNKIKCAYHQYTKLILDVRTCITNVLTWLILNKGSIFLWWLHCCFYIILLI